MSGQKENGENSEYSWSLPDTERKKMTMAESRVMFPNISHSWQCDGEVLRLHNPKDKDIKGLFKVSQCFLRVSAGRNSHVQPLL